MNKIHDAENDLDLRFRECLHFLAASKGSENIFLNPGVNDLLVSIKVFYQAKKSGEANFLIKYLTKQVNDEMSYFTSFSEEAQTLYKWDINTGVEIMEELMNLANMNNQSEVAMDILKDYAWFVNYYSPQYAMKKGA